MTHTRTQSISQRYAPLLQRLFWICLALIFFTLLSYGYLVNKTVHNIVVRQNDQGQLATIRSHIAELEAEQIRLKSSIDEDEALALGFHEVGDPYYVSLGATGATSDTVSFVKR